MNAKQEREDPGLHRLRHKPPAQAANMVERNEVGTQSNGGASGLFIRCSILVKTWVLVRSPPVTTGLNGIWPPVCHVCSDFKTRFGRTTDHGARASGVLSYTQSGLAVPGEVSLSTLVRSSGTVTVMTLAAHY